MGDRRSKRHPLDGVAPEHAIQARCLTCRKIVLVAEFHDELLAPVIRHYELHHPDVAKNVFLQGPGGHFDVEKAPPARCDLCGLPAELPWWNWVTPWTDDYDVQDEEWLVCDGCHPLVADHNVIALCRRVWTAGASEFVVDDPVKRKEEIREVMVRFLNHVDPTRTQRETVA